MWVCVFWCIKLVCGLIGVCVGSHMRVWSEVKAGYRLAQPAGCPEDVYKLMEKTVLASRPK